MKKFCVLLFLLSCFSGCNPSIGDLIKNAPRHQNKKAAIRGTIEQAVHIPFTAYNVYLVRDTESSIPVISAASYYESESLTIEGKIVQADEAEKAVSIMIRQNEELAEKQHETILRTVMATFNAFIAMHGIDYCIIEMSF
jgi:hypothetical protein